MTLAVRRQSALPEKQNETGDNPEKQENKGQDRKNGRSGQSGETPFGGGYPSFDDLFPFGDDDSFNGNGPF